MGTVTKPYGDFTNSVDVADANKVNSQLNTLYTLVNGNIDNANIKAAILDAAINAVVTATANTIPRRDANSNVVSAYPVSNGQNPNLLFNPSFRLGSTGWSGIGSNGFASQFGIGGEGSILQNATSTTSSSVQVDNHLNYIPASASTQFTISGEMYASGVTAGSIGLQWYAYDTNKAPISGGSVSATNGQGWTKYSLTFTTPANTVYLQIACLISANTTNTNAGWRKIKVEAGSFATTFSDDNTVNTQQYGTILPFLQVLSGGNKLESGTGSITVTANTANSVTITLPAAFANAPLPFATLTGGTPGTNQTVITAWNASTTSFTVSLISAVGATYNFNWFAIGS